MSATPRHIVLSVFVLESLALVQGRVLLVNHTKQADALKHELDLASKVGDIGKFTFISFRYIFLNCVAVRHGLYLILLSRTPLIPFFKIEKNANQ